MPLTKQAHWYALVEEWRLSGSTKRAFCQQRALNIHTFGYWIKKFRTPTEASSKSEANFSSSAFVRLDATQSTSLSVGSEQIEIQLAALTLRLPVTALSEALAQLKQGGWL